ncbi:MFS transporter [Pollutimonas bauzanensis]|uniref:Major Facilitator Superfamily protein n=1 Tax=Pollutimonas bauzanensis TaxID=658167 RepID=A0A1M5Y2L9_9BURK|nr:MFS transporter [Pollutimonas bauzanensis]SHI06048.1 Major Facilitator Superfamily protein [Pollutimonas bauzanensis]SHI39467.1 Major Facilitator Superfamily protein [Pollutimonas bauzanensis]
MLTHDSKPAADPSRRAYQFVLLIGVLSFFADFTYEGARSILGPYLASLQATATIVGVVTGFGELAGYGLRLVSGRLADTTQQFWPITISGYVLQMAAVPALALTHSWQAAAVLIILERVGKAIRNPPRDVMLSYAAQQVGRYGWVFGIHESLDQLGALFGPLVVALILAQHGSYRESFAVLALPALINLCFVGLARWRYPRPQDLVVQSPSEASNGLPRVFWIYLLGAGLIAAGFADYPLIAYHFSRAHTVPNEWIAAFYAVAMAVSGSGSLLFGRLFDRYGFRVLIGLTLLSALFAPLVFLGNFWVALVGAAIWGLGMGVHESIIPAAVAPMVSSERRASAFGLFTAGYGVFWFAGSAAIGMLYDRSVWATIVFCVVAQLAAIPLFIWVSRRIHK